MHETDDDGIMSFGSRNREEERERMGGAGGFKFGGSGSFKGFSVKDPVDRIGGWGA